MITLIATIAGIATVLGAVCAGAVKLSRGLKALDNMAETILGETEVKDRSGVVVRPGTPSLAGRMTKVEEAIISLTDLNARLVRLEERIARDEEQKVLDSQWAHSLLAGIEERLRSLET